MAGWPSRLGFGLRPRLLLWLLCLDLLDFGLDFELASDFDSDFDFDLDFNLIWLDFDSNLD